MMINKVYTFHIYPNKTIGCSLFVFN
ncbi:helix-turn-helix domain-containing protein, partial [Bacillus cereus]